MEKEKEEEVPVVPAVPVEEVRVEEKKEKKEEKPVEEKKEKKPEEKKPEQKEKKIEISDHTVDEVMEPIEAKAKQSIFYYWPIQPSEHCLRWEVNKAVM